jgi:hypothetical protein
MNKQTTTIVYQSKNGALTFKTDRANETIWLTQDQIAELFDVQKAAISKHLRNIFNSEELEEKPTVSILETVAKNNKVYKIKHFNLDAVISVGYRVNSKKATHFRQWATKTLKEHIQKGYTINRHRIKTNYDEFLRAVSDVKSIATGATVDNDSVLELVALFADTWFSLNMQSFGGTDLYPSIEEKAAHLLYFFIKNHLFVDGNKRSGAYAFVWFLRQAKILDIARITPPALTALTLLIAESAPAEKDKLIGLVCTVLKK